MFVRTARPRWRFPLGLAAVLVLAAGCPVPGDDDSFADDDDIGDDDDTGDDDTGDDDTADDDTADDDTGDDDTDPPPDPCSFDGLAPVDLVDTHRVGEFTVDVDAGGRVVVSHDGDPARPLFEPPAAGAWLHVGRADLQVTEHQGSFAVEVDGGVECTALRLDVASASGDTGDLRVEGGFDDCAASGFVARFCQADDGHLALAVDLDDPDYDLIRLHAASAAGEHIFGMGEQFPHDTLDLKGRVIPVLSQEGGVGRGHIPITPAVELVSPGSGGSEESTYLAAPHYLTSEDRSLFLEDTEYAVFDFSQDEVISLSLYAPSLHGRVLYGDGPLDLVERYTAWAGRMPPPPPWASEGAIVALAGDLDEGLERVDDLLAEGAAISAVWNQTWSGLSETYIGEQVLWNWVQDPNTHPGWADWVDALDDRGLRTLCYVNPMFRDVPEDHGPVARNLFEEADAAGHLVMDGTGETLLLEVTAFEVGLLDLSNPAARDWMKAVITDEMMTAAGCSGWMADFGEALPFDAELASGEDAAGWHNHYPVEWARLNREAVEEAGALGDVLFWSRSGAARSPGTMLMLWEGDQLTTWDKYDGLVSALHGLIGGGFSGLSLNHSDIGGYTSVSFYGLGYSREEEQLLRWTEMAAFSALMRTHEGNQPGENAQVYDNDTTREHFSRMTRVYRALGFYREQLYAEAEDHGWPVVRHLAMHHPDDETAWTIDDQFLLGEEILVAPIKNKCWTWPWCPYDKELYLPAGEWVHLWTGDVYGDANGEWINVPAEIGEPAVFYRADGLVGPELVDRLAAEGIPAG